MTSSSVTSLIRSISMIWEVPIPEEDGEVTLELLVLAADMALLIFHFKLLGLGMFTGEPWDSDYTGRRV